MKKNFWCNDPEWVVHEAAQLWPSDIDQAVTSADNVLKGCFAFQDHWEMERCSQLVDFGSNPRDIQWDSIPFGDVEWLYALNRHTYFTNLGKAWLYTRNDKYALRYAELIKGWIDRNPLTEQNCQTTWRSLEAGLRCEYWLRALQMFHGSKALTDDLLKKIDACLHIHGEYLVKQSRDFQKFSNWGVLQDHGLFLLAVWFNRKDWADLAIQRLDKELHHQVMSDGTHWEQSPMYHCEVLHCALDTILIAHQNKHPLPRRFEENVHRMCCALLAMITPDGKLICQGDSDAIDARDLLALGALLFNDPQLRSVVGKIPYPETLWDLGKDAYKLSDIASQSTDTSIALPDSGNILLRSDTGPNAAYLHFHCGSIGGGHGHADMLHIDAGIGDERVLIDSGRYTYINSPLRLALKSPSAHNTTTVDNMDFTNCLDTWTWDQIAVAVKGEHRFTDHADFVSGHHLGYLNHGVCVGREIIWLKEWNTAVIFDQFFADSKASHQYKQYFHFGNGQVQLCKNRVDWKGEHTAASLICLGEVECQLGKAPYSTEYNQLLEGDLLTVRRTQSGFGWFITVLDLSIGQPLTARLVPLSCSAGSLNSPHAQAVELYRGEKNATIILRCGDAVPPSAMLRAGDHEGYGRAILFDDTHPDGFCLAW